MLKPLYSKKIPIKRIFSFDTETFGENNTFLMGSIYDGQEYRTFYDKQEMADYIIVNARHFSKAYLVATNLGFDITVLFYDTEYWSRFDLIMKGSNIVEAVYKTKDDVKIIFIDSQNYVGGGEGSVEALGNLIGEKKLEKPLNLGKKHISDELVTYNHRDCEITYKFMIMLQSEYNNAGAKMRITSASTSLDAYRRQYMRFPIKSEVDIIGNVSARAKVFSSYYGGRTEIFVRGLVKNIKLYDFNSLYPSVMMNEYPDPNTVKFQQYPTKDVLEYEGVSYVEIVCPYMHIPLLPLRREKKLIFPYGTYKGTYTHLELRKAIIEGYTVKRIHWSMYYRKTYYPFKEYVIDMYNKRNELKKVGNPKEIVYKLFMNSLYGKFAQKKLHGIQFFDLKTMTDEEAIDFHTYIEGREIILQDERRGYYVTNKACKHDFVMPILSSYTTAYGRIKLYEYLNKYDGYYCDTDSIMTRKELPTTDKLGDLKLEQDIRTAILIKPKAYQVITEKKIITKFKGVPRVSPENFVDILDNKSVEYMKFSKLRESIRKEIQPNSKYYVTKYNSLEDDKRKWLNKFNAEVIDKESTPHLI